MNLSDLHRVPGMGDVDAAPERAAVIRAAIAGTVLVTMGVAPACWSQDEPIPPAAPVSTIPLPPEEPDAPLRPAGDDATLLEPIIVTAVKRPENSRDVAASITAFSGEQLAAIGASDFEGFAYYVPGLAWERNAGPGAQTLTLRGISAGTNSATTGVYVDETPIGATTIFGNGDISLDFAVFDLDRIEVLRGPQGTLYGTNTLGGLLKYVTRDPEPGAWASALAAEWSFNSQGDPSQTVRAMVNVPIGSEPWAARVSGSFIQNGGYIDSPRTQVENSDGYMRDHFRAVLLGDISPALSLRLSVHGQDIERDGASFTDRDLRTHEPIRGVYDRGNRFPEPSNDHSRIVSGVLDWTPGDLHVVSISGYQSLRSAFTLDITDVYDKTFFTGENLQVRAWNRFEVEKLVQEVRVQSAPASASGKWLEWVGGVFVNVEKSQWRQSLLRHDAPNGDLSPGVRIFEAWFPTQYREYAAFGTVDGYLTPFFDVALGARYTLGRHRFRRVSSGALDADPVNGTEQSKDTDEQRLTWLVNPRYRLGEDHVVYARTANAYRAGTPNVSASKTPTQEDRFKPFVDPDSLVSHEVGLKSTLLGGAAVFDVAFFHIDWTAMQLVVSRGGAGGLANAGKARSQGAELSGFYRILDPITLGVSSAWIHARLTEDAPELPGKKGDPLPIVPRLAGALTVDCRFAAPFGLWANALGAWRYSGPREAGFPGSVGRPRYRLPAHHLFDLRFAVHGAAYAVTLYGRNLFDRADDVTAFSINAGGDVNDPVPVLVSITQPRTIGLDLSYEF